MVLNRWHFRDAQVSPSSRLAESVSVGVHVLFFPSASMCACGRERLHVLVSVCVSVWVLAEGCVSSNLGQTRDGKVNAAVKLKDRDAHAQMRKRDQDVEKHTYGQTERRAHKRRYLWETRLMWKGQNSHGIHRCTPPTCAAFISVCASVCVCGGVRGCVF